MLSSDSTPYLIVAYYNQVNWNKLIAKDKRAFQDSGAAWAPDDPNSFWKKTESIAEELFPEGAAAQLVAAPGGGLHGARIAQTFASDLFTKLPTNYFGLRGVRQQIGDQ